MNTYLIFIREEAGLINFFFIPFYVMDMALNFLYMYWKDVNLINSPKMIAYKYLRKGFWIDLLPTFPFFAFHKTLLFFKFVRILNLDSYIDKLGQMEEIILIRLINLRKEFILTIQRATRLMIYLAYSVHWFACFWIWIGQQNSEQGWIDQNKDLVGSTNVDIYIASMYSIVTTFSTVGYGDILGSSNSEYIFQSVLEL